ncbi:MAG: DUF885 family protein [Candidatus Magnetomorum sp.]|nr:DUF885 family protein [Candidatus Magnetomorum sp.]
MKPFLLSSGPDQEQSLSGLTQKIFDYLLNMFPIACSSDEFWFFPQVVHKEISLCRWDHFSQETILGCCQKLSRWDMDIQALVDIRSPSNETELDAYLVSNMVRTLQEHLEYFRPWERQPTFHLTIACIGLSQALTFGSTEYLRQRVLTLPAFLKRASTVLKNVPALFMESGLNMIKDTRLFFNDCISIFPEMQAAIEALDDLKQTMIQLPVMDNFLIPTEDYAHLVDAHMQTRLDLKTISDMLDSEICQAQENLNNRCSSHQSSEYLKTVAQKQCIKPEKNSALSWFSKEVHRLKSHCEKHHIISEVISQNCPVRIDHVPNYLKAIRTASSYSFSPFQKKCQGTFYVLSNEAEMQKNGTWCLSNETPMLTAHETYPGHHLLDASRSRLSRWIRRPLESPLFYEGWACFSEVLMLQTNFYETTDALYLINKRRLWRAVRGKIDLNIHWGKMTVDEAADHLHKAGIDLTRAQKIVRQYPLHPGYQLCYTIGLIRFLELQSSSTLPMETWIQTILSAGEIPFAFLEKLLRG